MFEAEVLEKELTLQILVQISKVLSTIPPAEPERAKLLGELWKMYDKAQVPT